MEYYYPDNLKARATLWLWELKDIGIIGGALVFGIFVFAKTGLMLFMIAGAVYAFLTIRLGEITIRDFIVYASRFYLLSQKIFYWRKRDGKGR